eukprot:1459804-Amphidinium_carterae.1
MQTNFEKDRSVVTKRVTLHGCVATAKKLKTAFVRGVRGAAHIWKQSSSILGGRCTGFRFLYLSSV